MGNLFISEDFQIKIWQQNHIVRLIKNISENMADVLPARYNMTDFRSDAGEELDRMVSRACEGWSWLTVANIVFSLFYFGAHIDAWMMKGHPVARDTYRASRDNLWLVDESALKIKKKKDDDFLSAIIAATSSAP